MTDPHALYDAIIIGGGIAGLYTAYKLTQRGMKCLLLEKDKQCGGRVWTKVAKMPHEDVIYECGANKLLPSHVNMLCLIRSLGFSDKDLVCSKKVVKYKSIPTLDALNNEKYDISTVLKTILNDILRNMKRENYSDLVNTTLLEWLEQRYAKDVVQFVLTASGYAHLFRYCNAYNGILYIENDLLAESVISFAPGLSCITDKLDFLYTKRGGKIERGVDVISIDEKEMLVNKYYKGKHIIFAVPPKQLEKIKGIPENIKHACKNVVGVRLMRVFGKGNIGEIPYTHIGNQVQRTMRRANGFYQFVYASDRNALFWKNVIKNHKFPKTYGELYKPSKTNCNSINNIESYYWSEGIHLWKKGVDGNIIWNSLTHKNNNIWVVGEAFSPYQRWMESAIITSKTVVKLVLEDIP